MTAGSAVRSWQSAFHWSAGVLTGAGCGDEDIAATASTEGAGLVPALSILPSTLITFPRKRRIQLSEL
jgi:hypothetical protein